MFFNVKHYDFLHTFVALFIAIAVCVYLCVGFNVSYIKHPAYLIVLWLSKMLIK